MRASCKRCGSDSFLCGPFARKNSRHKGLDELYGFVDGSGHGLAQPHLSFFWPESGWHAANQQYSIQLPAHACCHPQYIDWIHSMRFHKTWWCSRRIQFFQVRLDNEETTWFAFAGISIHEKGRRVAVHQGIRKVQAANPKVRHAYT